MLIIAEISFSKSLPLWEGLLYLGRFFLLAVNIDFYIEV